MNEQMKMKLRNHDTGCLGLVHWDDPEGWYGEGGRRMVQDGEHILWQIHFDIWQNQYNIVKFKNKIKFKKKKKKKSLIFFSFGGVGFLKH